MMAVIALSVISVNAQKGTLYLGTNNIGGESIESNVSTTPAFFTGFWATDDAGMKTSTIGINPEVGYFLQDNLAVGLGIGLSYETEGEVFGYGFAPYVRYYFKTINNFSLYGQCQYSYASNDQDGHRAYWDLGVKPGIAYNLTDRFALTATYGFLGYQEQGASNAMGLKLDWSTLNFGLSVSF